MMLAPPVFLLLSLTAIAAFTDAGSQDSMEDTHVVETLPGPSNEGSREGTSGAAEPHSSRLFGHRVAPGVLFPNPPTISNQLPPHHLKYAAETVDKLPIRRSIAQQIAHDIIGGQTTPLADAFYNPISMVELLNWSRDQFSNPKNRFYVHTLTTDRGSSVAYLIREIPMKVFHDRLFTHGHLDKNIWRPYAVYVAEMGQRDFFKTGGLQIAGVELFRDHVPGWKLPFRTEKMELQRALALIEHGM